MDNLTTQFAAEVKEVFLDTTQFAEYFQWTHGSTTTRIAGKFTRPFEAVNVALHIEASRPTILVATEDVDDVEHGDTLEREDDDTVWSVYKVETGVNGITSLSVQEAA